MRSSPTLLGFVLVLAGGCREPTPSSRPSTTTTTSADPSAFAAAPAVAGEEVLPLATTSTVGFQGAKVTASHDGSFERLTGTVRLFPAAIERSQIFARVDMASLRIEPERLATHLRSADFFDVEHFPTATFQSTSVRAGGENGATHTITGNLTLRGQSRSVTFPAQVYVTPTEFRATAQFSINRREWGIVYAGMPDNLIRDAVTLRLSLQAPRSATH